MKKIDEQNTRLSPFTPRVTAPVRTVKPSPPRKITPPKPVKPPVDQNDALSFLKNFSQSLIGRTINPTNINLRTIDGQSNINGVLFKIKEVYTFNSSVLKNENTGKFKISMILGLANPEDQSIINQYGLDDNSKFSASLEDGNEYITCYQHPKPIIITLQDNRFSQYVQKNYFDKVKEMENNPITTQSINENKMKKKKIIKLTESQIKNLIENVVLESVTGKEPVMKHSNYRLQFIFESGRNKPTHISQSPSSSRWVTYQPQYLQEVYQGLADWMKNTKIIDVLKQYRKGGLPKFITIGVGTSHTGTDEVNASVAEKRFQFLEGVVSNALKLLGVDAQYVKSFIVRDSNTEYTPTATDRDFFNKSNVEEDMMERFGVIQVNALKIVGSTRNQMRSIHKNLNSASSTVNNWIFDGVNEKIILDNILRLKSWDDVKELSQDIVVSNQYQTLEAFLNDQLFDDPKEMTTVYQHLRFLANQSGLPNNQVRLLSSGSGRVLSIGV